MDKKEKATEAAVRRGIWFLNRYSEELGPVLVVPAVRDLNDALAALNRDSVEQRESDGHARSGTVARSQLRVEVRDEMRPLAAVAQARLIGLPHPEMVKFDVPPTNIGDRDLIDAARAMAEAVSKHFEIFVEAGCGESCVDNLNEAAKRLEDRLSERSGHRLSRRRAVLGVDVAVAEAKKQLRVITGFVIKAARNRPDIVGAWRQATKIGKTSRTSAKPADLAAPAAQPAVQLVAAKEVKAAAA